MKEATEQLQRFRLDLVDKVANRITTERQLCTALGLPPTDNRRIIPATGPIQYEVRCDWMSSVVQMLANRPEFGGKLAIQASDLTEMGIASPQNRAVVGDIIVLDVRAGGNDGETGETVDKAALKSAMQALAERILDVDSKYKSFTYAGRLKTAAAARLEAQREFFDQGTITIDRYLDAINRWACAVAQEADFRAPRPQ